MSTLSMVALALLAATSLRAQDPYVDSSAPHDRPAGFDSAAWKRAEAAMAPYVSQARATWPQARSRFLHGLPPKHGFFVTVRLRDAAGRREQAFLAVDSIRRDSIFGRIWSQIGLVRGFRLRQPYALPETELVDWVITKPDGSEEGNVVGIFMDTYKP